MAFGFKLKTFETSKPYSMEELYEASKDTEFSAGKPELAKHGFAVLIVFPPLDRNNQIRIGQGSMGKGPFSKFQVTKGEIVGMGNMAKGIALHGLTNGWSSASGVLGKNAKDGEALVVKTYEELRALSL